MLILLCGEDLFRSRQKLNEIIREYQAKHQSGLSLARFGNHDLDFEKFKEKAQAISMFDEKKLIILENIFKNKNFLEEFSSYSKKNKLKDNQDVIVVIYQEGKLSSAAFKRQANMFEEFKLLQGAQLANWVKKEVVRNEGEIDPEALKRLIAYVGDDLWQMSNEINKLVSYNRKITEADIDLLVKAKVSLNIFNVLDALANKDKKTALGLLHQHLNEGENEIYLLTMFTYQLRSLLKLKDLMDKGTSYYDLHRRSGLHPFVVKKSSQQLNNFTLEQLKKTYHRLLDIDWKIKIGQIDGPTALDLLVAEI